MADSIPNVAKPSSLPLSSNSASREHISPPARSIVMTNSGGLGHRSSFAENMRPAPPSPRTPRHPSFTQAAVQELINHPQITRPGSTKFAGRDWRQIKIGELVSKDDVRFVESDTGIEEATKVGHTPQPSKALCRIDTF
jgi:hypothetical protein